ncbi:MAG: DUF6338 family protein [Gammaproteobacteria bacterium]|nr:DUF6338 family protein [Gammaproteobacteria bacterium]
MDIWNIDKLLLFIAFVTPGFISLKTYELLFPTAPKETNKLLIEAVTYSSINYALLLWPIYEVETCKIRESNPTVYILFYVFVLLFAPIVWACLAKCLRTTQFLQNFMPHPTAKPWDYIFGQRTAWWVIVTLKEGKQVAGKYASASFASSSPALAQLYLEEAWELNAAGGFERARTDTAGILILSSEILAVEFFNLTTGVTMTEKKPQQPLKEVPIQEGYQPKKQPDTGQAKPITNPPPKKP